MVVLMSSGVRVVMSARTGRKNKECGRQAFAPLHILRVLYFLKRKHNITHCGLVCLINLI